MQYYVGMDVHSKESVFVMMDGKGKLRAQGALATTPEGFQRWQGQYPGPRGTAVALESGPVAFVAARQLRVLGLTPGVGEAQEVRLQAQRPRQKSDRRAAHELCEGRRRGRYRSLIPIPPVPISALREPLARRRHFVRVQTAEINAAKHVLRAAGLGHLKSNLPTSTGGAKLTVALGAQPALQRAVGHHQALWPQAQTEVRALEQLLAEQQPPLAADLQRLQTIPGVGRSVARPVVAVFSEVERFPSATQVASDAGLVPTTAQSGERDRHGHIPKQGSGELRALLCEAAQPARHADPPLTPYFAARCAKRGYRLAVGAVAPRLCRIMVARLRTQRDFDLKRVGVEEGPLRRTLVRRYRRKAASAAHLAA
jgi:transposase